MKKLFALSVAALTLAACSHGDHRGPHGKPPHNPEVEAAIKACHETVGKTEDRSKFDACMKEKGFEKPAGHPKARSQKSN